MEVQSLAELEVSYLQYTVRRYVQEKDKKTVRDGVPDVPAETAAETFSDIAA